MLIYLSEYIHPDTARMIRQRADITDNFNRIEDIDGIILRTVNVNRRVISQAKELKVIGKHGVGCNTIDLNATREAGTTVMNTPLANTNSAAELIVGLMLDISRNIAACNARTRGEGLACIAPPEMTGIELTGKTVGLVGMGNIARRMGETLRNGFSVRLVGYDPYCSEEQTAFWGIRKYDDLSSMLEASDFVNISVPLTPSTMNMISEENFDHFRKNAVLIGAARGGVVNRDDLYHTLKGRRLRTTACDAFVKEPPRGTNKLMTLDNLCTTPHTGANTEEALYRMGMEVVEEILDVIDGKNIKNRII